MSVKAKTKKRLIVVAVAVLGMTGLAGGTWALKVYRQRARFASELAMGKQAAKDGDATAALPHLAYWLDGHPSDVEVLNLYANQWSAADPSDPQVVWGGIRRLRRLVELSPDDDDARRQLMKLYARYGFTTEAKDAAQAILDRHPADVDAIKYKLAALVRLRQLDQALAVAERWETLVPGDVDAAMNVLQIMVEQKRPAEAIQARAEKSAVAAAHVAPDAPQADLLRGLGHALTGDIEGAQKLLKQAAGRKQPNPAFARVLSDQLNRLGLYDDSLTLLQRVAKESNDPDVKAALVRRMWELGRAADVLALTDDLASTGKLGHEAAALRASALAQAGKRDEAAKALDGLRSAHDDLADAWVAILGADAGGKSPDSAKALLKVCQQAVRKDSQGGYMRYFIGHAYSQLDEPELAIEAWQGVAQDNPTWNVPLIRLAEARLSKGRYGMARMAALEAVHRNPSAIAGIALAKVMAARMEAGEDENPEQLLTLISDIRKQLPQEQSTLAMQVSLLAKLKRVDEAKAELAKALASKSDLDEPTLLRLAAVSRRYDLGLSDACFDRCEHAHGLTPSLAYARAVDRFSLGKPAEGMAILRDARKGMGKGDDTDKWEMAWAQYLELTGDKSAKDEWVRIADAHPDDREIQQAALRVASTRKDRAFIDRTIERLRKMTGDEGVTWKLARARWILEGDKTDQGLTQATMLLKDAIRLAPDSVDARILSAQAYERLGNVSGAIEQLQAAAASAPSNTQIALQLSRLLQKNGEFDKARAELNRVAAGKATDVAQRRQAAVLMAQMGDAQRAIELLQADTQDGQDEAGGLILATLYRQRNELAKAEQIVTRLLKEKPEPAVVQFAADLYAQLGRNADAERALAMLDTMKLDPGIKELLLADHASRHAGPDKAIELFRASLTKNPENSGAWRALIGFYASLGRGKEMVDAAKEGVRAVPSDEVMKAVVAEGELLAECDADLETRALVLSYLSQPKPDGPALLGMRAIVSAKKDAGDAGDQTVATLRKLVDANPTYAPLQSILAARYLRAGRAEEAAQLTSRAVQMFPTDPEPARLAVEATAASGRWPEALGFARAWRSRIPSNQLAADLAISTCLLRTNQPAQAAEAIVQYLPQARQEPSGNGEQVIFQYASALIANRQEDKAADLLWPLAKDSAKWRKNWALLSVALPPEQAGRWLERVETILPAGGGQEERAALAEAWHVLGTTSKDQRAIAKSAAIFDALLAMPDVDMKTVLSRGVVAEQDGDLAAAEAAYRRVIAADRNAYIAQNNLAMVILRRGGDVSEAMKLAQAAVNSQPRFPSLWDTLGQVQARAKDPVGAEASLRKAIAIDPAALEWRVHLAQVLFDSGKRADAAKVLQEIASLPPQPRSPSGDVQRQLDHLRVELSREAATTP